MKYLVIVGVTYLVTLDSYVVLRALEILVPGKG